MKMFNLETFAVGDSVTFERSFTPADFQAFATLSGDRNPLHHDARHAAETAFGDTIVPLHLTMMPLSMIAGMVFPGEPSLYLGHEIRAAQPVFYGDALRYCARITAINSAYSVLSLRVLALRGTDVVLDATMQVKATAAQWQTPPALPVHKASEPGLALVTGAAGEIGGAVALALARQGFNLLLQLRAEDGRSRALKDRLVQQNANVQFIVADLASQAGQTALAQVIAESAPLSLLVHAASPKVTAKLEALAAVNFGALKAAADAALPGMLSRQQGAVLLVGSLATERALPGWENYAAAKNMAAGYLAGLDRLYSPYGVRGLVLMPGLVATEFSKDYQSGGAMLLAQEVAEAALRLAQTDGGANVMMLEAGVERLGRLGFYTGAAAQPQPAAQRDTQSAPVAGGNAELAALTRRILKLPGDADLAQAGLGSTPGWDSLGHITLLLEIESKLGVKFASSEMEAIHQFAALDALVRNKLAAANG